MTSTRASRGSNGDSLGRDDDSDDSDESEEEGGEAASETEKEEARKKQKQKHWENIKAVGRMQVHLETCSIGIFMQEPPRSSVVITAHDQWKRLKRHFFDRPVTGAGSAGTRSNSAATRGDKDAKGRKPGKRKQTNEPAPKRSGEFNY
jgi:hypothetical protein